MAETAPVPTERPKMEQPFRERLNDYAGMALHGVAAAVAQKRLERAGDRMETMDHKDALYKDLGNLAMTGARTVSKTANGEPAVPRTTVERFVDRRYEKKGFNKSIADLRVYRAQKIYGPSNRLGGVTKHEQKHGKKFGHTADELESAASNNLLGTNHGVHFGTPMIKGTKEIKKEARAGKLPTREARNLTTLIEAQPLKLGAQEHKLQGKRAKRAGSRVENATDQRYLKRWRNMRRTRAIGTIQKQHVNQESHTAAKEQLLVRFNEQTEKRRQVRKERRVYYKAKTLEYSKRSLEFTKRNAPKAKTAAKALGRGAKVVGRKGLSVTKAAGRKLKRS